MGLLFSFPLIATATVTQFFAWFLLEFLERKFSMAPAVRRATSIDNLAEILAADSFSPDAKRDKRFLNRVTHTLDKRGRFRIQTRGTIYFIRAIWQATLLTCILFLTMLFPDWWTNHFIELDTNTINERPYRVLLLFVCLYVLIQVEY